MVIILWVGNIVFMLLLLLLGVYREGGLIRVNQEDEYIWLACLTTSIHIDWVAPLPTQSHRVQVPLGTPCAAGSTLLSTYLYAFTVTSAELGGFVPQQRTLSLDTTISIPRNIKVSSDTHVRSRQDRWYHSSILVVFIAIQNSIDLCPSFCLTNLSFVLLLLLLLLPGGRHRVCSYRYLQPL